ncbi:MAG: hypothetical protein K6A41_04130 [Bacteroidales bacterium]|nr:hypothetical protein [Bacteroidales bacterium]
MITEDYVSFEIAKLLKEKGFSGEFHKHYWGYEHGKEFLTEGSFNPEYDYPAPTLQMAMKWLREIKGISIDIITDWEWARDPITMTKIEIEYPEASEFTGYYYEIHQLEPHRLLYDSAVISKNREEACEAAIKYCLENLI